MSEQLLSTPDVVTRQALDLAAAAYCCRFGEPELEARRRGCVRAMQRSSSAFALVLEQFTARAAPHLRGEHPTVDMRVEVDAIARAFADWSFAVNAAADAGRDDRRATANGEERPAAAG